MPDAVYACHVDRAHLLAGLLCMAAGGALVPQRAEMVVHGPGGNSRGPAAAEAGLVASLPPVAVTTGWLIDQAVKISTLFLLSRSFVAPSRCVWLDFGRTVLEAWQAGA